jgi:trehalose 6-phosphate phosphatase
MRSIFGRAGIQELARFARSKTLVAFDFDGTLAPIVAARDEARMDLATLALLRKVSELFPTAVISGRSRADLRGRLRGAGIGHMVGNHGLEPAVGMRAFERATARIRLRLAGALVGEPGIEIEDKRYSLALHYRRASVKRDARAAIQRAIADLPSAPRVIAGKLVVNLLPQEAPHKGIALCQLQAHEGAETAIYVGDDVTDEDVFALDECRRLLAIRVGRSRTSAARFFLRDQRAIDVLLARLLDLRSNHRGRRRGE